MVRLALIMGTVSLMLAAVPARAAELVELKQVHMCCAGCAKEVAAVLKSVEGVSQVACDRKTRTARFLAADPKAAQRALDSLAEAGFHGALGNREYAFKDDSGAKRGNVASLTVSGFHNSCPGCVRSFPDAIKPVAGVIGDNARSEVSTCQVRGNFDPVALVEALNKAGFHVKVQP